MRIYVNTEISLRDFISRHPLRELIAQLSIIRQDCADKVAQEAKAEQWAVEREQLRQDLADAGQPPLPGTDYTAQMARQQLIGRGRTDLVAEVDRHLAEQARQAAEQESQPVAEDAA
jgi:hypothetical protein